MTTLLTQQVDQVFVVSILILVILLSVLAILFIVKKVKISSAEYIRENNPDGVREVLGYIRRPMNYDNAKRILDNKSKIVYAQREINEELRVKQRARLLRGLYPHSTAGEPDFFIVQNEDAIRTAENRYNERKRSALSLLSACPDGISIVCGNIAESSITDSDIDYILNNKERIKTEQSNYVEHLTPQLNHIRRQYPLAVRAVCQEHSWFLHRANDVKALLQIAETLSEREDIEINRILSDTEAFKTIVENCRKQVRLRESARVSIRRCYGEGLSRHIFEAIDAEENFNRFTKALENIKREQTEFANFSREQIREIFQDWCCCRYSFDVNYEDALYPTRITLPIWQAFFQACCFDDSISYEYYPRYRKNRTSRQQLKSTYHYIESTFDKIFSFISVLQENYGERVRVVLANTDNLSENAYRNNFDYFIQELNSRHIQYFEGLPTNLSDSEDFVFVVVDIITENTNLKQFCADFFKERYANTNTVTLATTKIVYITLLKCYDGTEIEALNNIKRKEEEQRRQDEEDISRAQILKRSNSEGFNLYCPELSQSEISSGEQARLILQQESAIRNHCETISRLRGAISDWDRVRGIPHYFFYYYYPINRFENISEESQSVRSLIYRFKDGNTHYRVKELVVSKLRETFDIDDFSKMTFVCIPASTIETNNARYRSFSNDVCSELGMNNGFSHITISRERRPARLGGTDSACYSYDQSFFRGKLIILFDDIVTRGNSILAMKTDLESLGATVICAISIGRTYSNFHGDNRRPHPYTGTI